ncbi:hypothetical protein ABZ845_03340 [Streptomyces sp. NPDC047022]|uniref:hypothetical protein n=1 Tax=Streptomyces sp. NPDC047022 TaxID=3155737 RepID=UPI0033D5C72A
MQREGRHGRGADDLAHVEHRYAAILDQGRDALPVDGVLSVVSGVPVEEFPGTGQLLNVVRRCEPVPGRTAGPGLEPLEERELRP